jgi:hypothetical protein
MNKKWSKVFTSKALGNSNNAILIQDIFGAAYLLFLM